MSKAPENGKMTRRDALVTLGGCVCAAAAAATGCTYSAVYGSLTAQSVAFDLADETFAPLQTVGSMVPLDIDGWRLILIRQSEDTIIGLDRICPHAFCDMTPPLGAWEDNTLICICHDSRFAPDGRVLQGPAETDLLVHDVRFDPATGQGVVVTGGLPDEGTGSGENEPMTDPGPA